MLTWCFHKERQCLQLAVGVRSLSQLRSQSKSSRRDRGKVREGWMQRGNTPSITVCNTLFSASSHQEIRIKHPQRTEHCHLQIQTGHGELKKKDLAWKWKLILAVYIYEVAESAKRSFTSPLNLGELGHCHIMKGIPWKPNTVDGCPFSEKASVLDFGGFTSFLLTMS